MFSYQVMPDDSDTNGISWAADALSLVVAQSSRWAGRMAPTTTVVAVSAASSHKVNGALTASGAATVSTVTVTSTPLLMAAGSTSADTYGVDETIEFTVTFSAAVTVTGDPEFEFSVSSPSTTDNRGRAAYASGSGTTALVFRYTVKATDADSNGIWVGNQSRTLKLDADDRILTASDNSLPASLTHDEKGTRENHKVDGSRGTPVANNAPVFDPAAVDLEITENTAADENVGAAVTATDADAGDTLAYTLGGDRHGLLRHRRGQRADPNHIRRQLRPRGQGFLHGHGHGLGRYRQRRRHRHHQRHRRGRAARRAVGDLGHGGDRQLHQPDGLLDRPGQ